MKKVLLLLMMVFSLSFTGCIEEEPLECPVGQHKIEDECEDILPTCKDGFYYDGEDCVSIPDITCDTGYHLEGSECIKDKTCDVGYYLENNECVKDPDPTCERGYEEINGNCVEVSVKRSEGCYVGYVSNGTECQKLLYNIYSLGSKSITRLGDRYDITDELDLYYFDNTNHTTYIDIGNFLSTFGNIYRTYVYYIDDELVIMFDDYGDDYTLIFNAEDNTITANHVDNYNYINQNNDPWEYYGYIRYYGSTEPNYTDVVYDLDQYDIDIIDYENHYYIPLYVANIFLTGSDTNVVETKDHLYLVDYDVDIHEFRDEFYYEDFYADVSIVAKDTETHLKIILDNFYGMKSQEGIESYIPIVDSYNIDEATSMYEINNAINDLTDFLDDAHTKTVSGGIGHSAYFVDRDNDRTTRVGTLNDEFELRQCNLRTNDYRVYDIGTVRFIELNGFDEGLIDVYNYVAIPDSDIDTVVFDLTCNTGGYLAYMLDFITLLNDETVVVDFYYPRTEQFGSYSYGTLNSTPDYEFYVLTSEVTYSAGNLFASMVKDYGLATIIGEPSSGGASPIAYSVLPSANLLVHSSDQYLINLSGESIEYGVEPDVYYDIPFENDGLTITLFNLETYVDYTLEDTQTGTTINVTFDETVDNPVVSYRVELRGDGLDSFYSEELYSTDFTFETLDLESYEFIQINVYATVMIDDYPLELFVAEYFYDEDIAEFNQSATPMTETEVVNAKRNFDGDIDTYLLEVTEAGVYTLQNNLGLVRSFNLFNYKGDVIGTGTSFVLLEGTYYLRMHTPISIDSEYYVTFEPTNP